LETIKCIVAEIIRVKLRIPGYAKGRKEDMTTIFGFFLKDDHKKNILNVSPITKNQDN